MAVLDATHTPHLVSCTCWCDTILKWEGWIVGGKSVGSDENNELGNVLWLILESQRHNGCTIPSRDCIQSEHFC